MKHILFKPEILHHKRIPDAITIGFQKLSDSENEPSDSHAIENLSGSHFIRKLAETGLGIGSLQLVTRKNEKPKAFDGKDELSVSFSHTRHSIAGAISRIYNVGCDLESATRKVPESLVKRMKAKEESESLYVNEQALRIWTCKEAALKMTGTGLRKPMSGVRLFQQEEELFIAEIDDVFQAEICSFLHNGFWISVCFKKEMLEKMTEDSPPV
ncbi:MAG: 4'-phosphopantetheinyl transferase superfamily protein [Balneolaceae bacterium]|nr:MAG: 4'-phosphopantetheinyl transferase superfamily protein [Balneolaceae bacterium]